MWKLILGLQRATLTGVMSELPSAHSDSCRNLSIWVQPCHIREANAEHQFEADLTVPQVTADRLGDLLEPVVKGRSVKMQGLCGFSSIAAMREICVQGVNEIVAAT